MAAAKGRTGLETASDFYPVTPDDANDLAVETRELIVAVGGTLKVRKVDQTDVTLTLPAGRFALKVVRVWATGTAATGITAVT